VLKLEVNVHFHIERGSPKRTRGPGHGTRLVKAVEGMGPALWPKPQRGQIYYQKKCRHRHFHDAKLWGVSSHEMAPEMWLEWRSPGTSRTRVFDRRFDSNRPAPLLADGRRRDLHQHSHRPCHDFTDLSGNDLGLCILCLHAGMSRRTDRRFREHRNFKSTGVNPFHAWVRKSNPSSNCIGAAAAPQLGRTVIKHSMNAS
jgi:hypothetical protein